LWCRWAEIWLFAICQKAPKKARDGEIARKPVAGQKWRSKMDFAFQMPNLGRISQQIPVGFPAHTCRVADSEKEQRITIGFFPRARDHCLHSSGAGLPPGR
jgi:hypothetical protein